MREFWNEKIKDKYSGIYKKMNILFWWFGEPHEIKIWPENMEVCERIVSFG